MIIEFEMIQEYYGKRVAERSHVPLIQHIREGLYIMVEEQATELAKQAYCLHPIFQSDEALQANYNNSEYLKIDSNVMLLVMEYRNIANAYLSNKQITNISEIQLSPLAEVNSMLVADKIQNYKDFEKYHKATHPRSKELTYYFENWLVRLGVTQEKYFHYRSLLEEE
ncbi:MAG: hypothetical protein SFU98_13695 [Leptospiraceae bacterium]|nr:hypothetical protein [Leptospiraceae bacterium]